MDAADVFIDGACSGNPGEAGIGVFIRRGQEVLSRVSENIGPATNNIAEYRALIRALQEAAELHIRSLNIFSDSQLMCNQLTGVYGIKQDHIRQLHDEAQHLAKQFERITIKHIPREQNKDADALASGAIKKKQVKAVASLFHRSGEESPSSTG
jgi:ribonuclease HI